MGKKCMILSTFFIFKLMSQEKQRLEQVIQVDFGKKTLPTPDNGTQEIGQTTKDEIKKIIEFKEYKENQAPKNVIAEMLQEILEGNDVRMTNFVERYNGNLKILKSVEESKFYNQENHLRFFKTTFLENLIKIIESKGLTQKINKNSKPSLEILKNILLKSHRQLNGDAFIATSAYGIDVRDKIMQEASN